MVFVMVGALARTDDTPPPVGAELLAIVQFVSVGEDRLQCTAPPLSAAQLPLIMQLSITGEPPL